MAADPKQLTVFYDASCPKCVRDRVRYERMVGERAADIDWMDITGRDTELRELGLDPFHALTELHVRDADGTIHSEIDAYILLMARAPRLRILAWMIGLPLIRPTLAWLYHTMVHRRLKRDGRL